ncbi:MPP_superfamily domain-containing protein [Histoplasma ohiense]|nr:MPP_superfamily domain-containing protein [Histoplasma ohiense (nom. inval.)]
MATISSSRRQSVPAPSRRQVPYVDQKPINGMENNAPFANNRYPVKRATSDSYANHSPILPAAPEVQHPALPSFRNSFNSGPSRRFGEGPKPFAVRAKELQIEGALDGLDRLSPTNSASWVESQRQLNEEAGPPEGRLSPHVDLQNVTIRKPRNNSKRANPPDDPVPPPKSNSSLSPHSARSNSLNQKRDGHLRRDWAPEKSPLQKLEFTLKDFSKEEKRARLEEAEMLLRDAKAGRRSRQTSRDMTPPSQSSTALRPKSTTDPSNLEETGLVRSLSAKQRDRLHHSAVIDSTKPDANRFSRDGRGGFDYEENRLYENRQHPPIQEQVHDEQYGIPRNTGRQKDWELSDTTPTQVADQRMNDAATLQKSQVPYNRIPEGHEDADLFHQETDLPQPSTSGTVQRSNSRKLQKPLPRNLNPQLQADPVQKRRTFPSAAASLSTSAAPAIRPATSRSTSSNLKIESDKLDSGNNNIKTTSNIGLGLSNATPPQASVSENQNRPARNGRGKHQHTVSFAVPPATPPPVSEWKNAGVGRLCLEDFDLRDVDLKKPWWEGGGSGKKVQQALPSMTKIKSNTQFNPPLYLECGPLLRYTGMKWEPTEGINGSIEQEVWKGSIMIVTKDSASDYSKPPSLRIFSQPMSLLPPPPTEISGETGELAPEYVDPIAGLTKLGRNGKLLYVKPVDHLEEGKDLSFIEDDDGLFEASPSPIDYNGSNQVCQPPSARIKEKDGESIGKFREIKGARLYADPARDVTFWRFNLEIELGDKQQRIGYRINQGSAIGFWVPAKGQSMNIMFHSGNGFSPSVDRDKFSGPDPLWRDVLNAHQILPFHVMIGGGDQIYNDAALFDTEHFRCWMALRVPYEERYHPFNLDIKSEMENFYLQQYLKWFSHGLFSMANSQIPMVNMWNDHDIIPGYGSYPDRLMRSPVMSGVGELAFKYYLLFQHQSVPEETDLDEPSWLFGATPGPYICQRSRSVFMNMGRRVAFLGIDCQTERTRDGVLIDDSADLILNRCDDQIMKGETKHLIVVLSVPIAYPRLAWLENVFSSRASYPVKAFGRAGIFGNLRDRFDVDTETIDSQWTSKAHKLERSWLIEDLQKLAADKSVRITILGGDAQVAAIGQFYSNPKLQIPKDQDYRYMPNVISSSIVNAPASEMMVDALNKRNKIHFLDTKTMEDMREIFAFDVDGKSRNNKRLLPRRNWCSIREYTPGSTPPQSPTESEPPSLLENRPGKLMRSLSLSRGDGKSSSLLRKLSQRGGPPPSRSLSLRGFEKRRMSYDGSPSTATHARDSYFPPQPQRPMTAGNQQTDDTTQPPQHPNNFLRRRTDLSAKEIKEEAKGGAFRLKNFINVEGGLDITLNCETNPRDPAGITHPYRVLVPALRFEGDFEPSEPRVKKHWWKISRGRKKAEQQNDEEQVGSEALIQPVEDMGQGQSHGHGQSHSGQKYEQEGPNHVARHPLKNHDNDYDDGYDDDDDDEYDDEVGLPPLPQPPPAGIQSVSAPSGGMATPQPRKKWFGII